MAATYSPGMIPVPSAMRGLTSLFGMGRGEHPRQNHHKILNKIHIGIAHSKVKVMEIIFIKKNKIKAYGQLVLLDFDVTIFTSVAYQRHRL